MMALSALQGNTCVQALSVQRDKSKYEDDLNLWMSSTLLPFEICNIVLCGKMYDSKKWLTMFMDLTPKKVSSEKVGH